MDNTTRKRWHARHLCWRLSVKWQLSKEDRQWIYCRFISDQSGHLGIHHVAQKLYQKPLTALNDYELASLVVASCAPTIFMRDRAKLNAATAQFLTEIKTHTRP